MTLFIQNLTKRLFCATYIVLLNNKYKFFIKSKTNEGEKKIKWIALKIIKTKKQC